MESVIDSFGDSDVGHVRTTNEDAWGSLSSFDFFVLADGMGGHLAGEVASKQTVDYLLSSMGELLSDSQKAWKSVELANMTKLLIENANTLIFNLGQNHAHLKGMGTTLCTLQFHDECLIYSHVGDSRIYRFRNRNLTQLTTDHIREAEEKLLELGKIAKSKGLLTRAIGPLRHVVPEVKVDHFQPGDLYLICSDGLTSHLSNQEIETLLSQNKDLQETTQRLIQAAKEKGGNDNITVILTQVLSRDAKKSLLRSQRHDPALS